MNSQKSSPNYKKIYEDILRKKYLHKRDEFASVLGKNKLSALEIIGSSPKSMEMIVLQNGIR